METLLKRRNELSTRGRANTPLKAIWSAGDIARRRQTRLPTLYLD